MTIPLSEYPHKQQPWEHQRKILDESYAKDAWAFFMEQGTGKSKVIIDTAAYAYLTGRIDALLIVCDKGIIRTWLEEHLPDNLPDHIPRAICAYVAGAKSKAVKFDMERAIVTDALSIIVTNWASFRTKAGREFLDSFMHQRKVMMALDESDAIKTPTSKQTRAIMAVGRRAVMKRIATGTPVADKPFDIFSQIRFLDKEIFGTNSFIVFKHQYGIWGTGYTATRSYPKLKGYTELDKLTRIVGKISHRVLKEECLDLPPKVYERVYVEIPKEQKDMLAVLKKDMLYGTETVKNPLVAVTRAVQLSSGFYLRDGALVPFPKQPKLDAIVQILDRMGKDKQAIIWGQFQYEVELIASWLSAVDISVVYIHGDVHIDHQEAREREFKNGNARVMVATAAAASAGRNWQNASTVIYHSNNPRLRFRLQSEDRAHRAGTKHSVTYWDVCMEGTADERRLDTLRGKKNIADIVTGDNVQEWL